LLGREPRTLRRFIEELAGPLRNFTGRGNRPEPAKLAREAT